MRKYKHKVENYIAYEQSQPSPEYEYIVKCSSNKGFLVPKELIEDSGDWELVVEKDWEILSFKSHFSDYKWELLPNKEYKVVSDKDYFVPCTLEKMLANKALYIYEVLRTKDREIFTLGDRVETIGIIQEFYILGNSIRLKNIGGSTSDINSVTKVSKPKPFITEDGISKYVGDTVWGVYPFDEFPTVTQKITEDNIESFIRKGPGYVKNRLWFSSEYRAKEYVILNKPVFSAQDIINFDSKKVEGFYSIYKGTPFYEASKRIKF